MKLLLRQTIRNTFLNILIILQLFSNLSLGLQSLQPRGYQQFINNSGQQSQKLEYKGRLAFLFIVPDDLNQLSLWKEFFNHAPSSDYYSIYFIQTFDVITYNDKHDDDVYRFNLNEIENQDITMKQKEQNNNNAKVQKENLQVVNNTKNVNHQIQNGFCKDQGNKEYDQNDICTNSLQTENILKPLQDYTLKVKNIKRFQYNHNWLKSQIFQNPNQEIAHATSLDAALQLISVAFNDAEFQNEKFLVLNEKSIPVYDFNTIYKALMINSYSYMDIEPNNSIYTYKIPWKFESLKEQYGEDLNDLVIHKAEYVLNRRHAELLISNHKQLINFWLQFDSQQRFRLDKVAIATFLTEREELHNIRNLCIAYEYMGNYGIKVEYGSSVQGSEHALKRDLIIDAKQRCLFLNNVKSGFQPEQEIIDVIFKSQVQF
eukprot:403343829